MEIKSVAAVYFSPTGTTKIIVDSVIKGMGSESVNITDITLPETRNSAAPEINEDIAIIGVPIYAGEIPEVVMPFLKSLRGNNKPVVLITLYGNMGNGIALNQLEEIARDKGFITVGAGEFIGEHSFSTAEAPVAQGRPNNEDISMAEQFGADIIAKLQKVNNLADALISAPKGSIPIMAKVLPKDSAKIFAKVPDADMSSCNRCGACVKLCPVNAIDMMSFKVDDKVCLRCFKCVRICRRKARQINFRPQRVVPVVMKLKSGNAKQPKVYY
jgi:Flavodoxins